MAYTSIYNGSQVDKGIGASYVSTLQSAPTSTTLTYTRTDLPSGSQTVNFEIGQLCRVANAGSSTGYDFYQLQNIVVTNVGEQDETTTASWLKTNIVYSVMGASGTNHASGLVPDPGSTAGTSKYLREDGTWATFPSGSNLGYTETTTGITNLDATLISTALRKTAQTLTTAEQTQVKANLGIPTYTASQTRNITFSTSEPTSADGSDGDIWLVYET